MPKVAHVFGVLHLLNDFLRVINSLIIMETIEDIVKMEKMKAAAPISTVEVRKLK